MWETHAHSKSSLVSLQEGGGGIPLLLSSAAPLFFPLHVCPLSGPYLCSGFCAGLCCRICGPEISNAGGAASEIAAEPKGFSAAYHPSYDSHLAVPCCIGEGNAACLLSRAAGIDIFLEQDWELFSDH